MTSQRLERAKIAVRGAVQGIGFRPFVYRLANRLRLNGYVLNSAQGLFIEAEGRRSDLEEFILKLDSEKPARAMIRSLEFSILEPAGYKHFEIRYSNGAGQKTVLILPDLAICPECRREISDPGARRYRYPFTNCTHCGPRFSIIESLPYDRANTSMKRFAMCAECECEYHDPDDRRFHAQPIACPQCGPQLELWDSHGAVLARADEALLQAVALLREGRIVALKGMGGFQLLADAGNEEAVACLRVRKLRAEKPFALMAPSLELVRRNCQLTEFETRLILSPEAPIVLLRRQAGANSVPLAPSVAPGNPYLGVMLPCTPLHCLLMEAFGSHAVATSGNLSNEPICIDEREALERLNGIADFFLVHDRPIVRPVDDSVTRVLCGREQVLRRARGYAPLPISFKKPLPTILAVGAHLKNSVALSLGTEVFLSQHIGDLETSQAHAAFRKIAADLPQLYGASPERIACDRHSDYLSSKYAAEISGQHPVCFVQHHWAHVLACMAENELEPPVLGIAWDGSGHGLDGTLWGGEFLLAEGDGFRRIAHLRPFRLPGGETAIREPRRAALGLLEEMWGSRAFEPRTPAFAPLRDFQASELALVRQMLARGCNAPRTSSAGRLFDAMAALLGLRQKASFEGQAAMELEFAIQPGIEAVYPFEIKETESGSPLLIDWQPMVEAALADFDRTCPVPQIAAKFHNTLAAIAVAMAQRIGVENVALSGGCFQNKPLTERTVRRLMEAGFRPHWHQRVPPNDGGIALGQIMATAIQNHKPSTD